MTRKHSKDQVSGMEGHNALWEGYRLVNGSVLMNGDEPRYGFDEVVKIFQDIVHNARMSVNRSCRQSLPVPPGVSAVASDVGNLPGDLSASNSSPGAGKRSAAEAFEGDSVEDLKDSETTLDDVLSADVDDNEEFPQQEEDMDADLALGLKMARKTKIWTKRT
ncbi:hypothetical protein GQ600_16573 [Phytophthora cactorum]|nr:hypothetical protein GQ600_16573 [Phytophthora cactorum]